MPVARPAIDRVMEKVVSEDRAHSTPCWIFRGSLNNKGYGVVNCRDPRSSDGVPRLAHKITYEHRYGSVPKGLELDHLCSITACCNPDHLDPVTHAENIRRGRSADALRAKYAAQTHCVHGHEYTPQNTQWKKKKGYDVRACRTCNRAYAERKRRERGIQPRAAA